MCRWNAAVAIMSILSSWKTQGKIYMADDEEQTTVGEFANLIADLGGWRRPFRVPNVVLGAASILGSGIRRVTGWKPPLTYTAYRKLTRDLVVDGSTIRKELGYKPLCSLEDGLREEIEWLNTGRIQGIE